MNAEQLFTRRRSATVYPASCIVHPASSAVDFQRSNVQTCKRSNASTLQPANLPFFHSSIVELFLEKEIQKNKPKSNLEPLHIRHHLIIPPHIRLSRVTQPELNDIYIEL
ncbi:MAG: hypothetical protein P8Y03_24260, partial [Anaerolineales bacterium]